MRKLLFTLSLTILSGMAFGQTEKTDAKEFTINGTIKGRNTGYIFLAYGTGEDAFKRDSARIVNGTFTFKGTIPEPVSAYLSGAANVRSMDDPNQASIFIEPGVMRLSLTDGNFKNLTLTGSKSQDEMKALEKSKEGIRKEMEPLNKAYAQASEAYASARKDKKPEAELEALKEQANTVRDQFGPYSVRMDKIDSAFIETHTDSYITAYLMRFKMSAITADSAKKVYNSWTPRIRSSNYGKAVLKEIMSLEAGSPGSVAAAFSAQDIKGVTLSLADFRNKKYVLLDFWASWCVPCRKGNPHLLSLYSKYKDKGLEIVGISDDDSAPEAWKKAVEKDGIGVWRHVLRGLKRTPEGFDRSASISEGYGIHTLPTKILIDKQGVIIGRYGGGGEDDAAMDRKLESLFN